MWGLLLIYDVRKMGVSKQVDASHGGMFATCGHSKNVVVLLELCLFHLSFYLCFGLYLIPNM